MKGRQLTFRTMGGDIVSIPVRGKHYVQPRGYADHPGTGPVGETCKTCQHCVGFRRWFKCDKARWKWTGGKASDILARAPACRQWERIQNYKGLRSTVLTEKEFLKLMLEISNEKSR